MSRGSSNPKVESLAARLVEPNRNRDSEYDEDDDEALFAELEAEIENDSNPVMREQGLNVIKQEMERMQKLKSSHHGSYTEVTDEKEVIRVSATEPRCVVHFYHTDFRRCEIMDKHLATLAPKYFQTRFMRVFVENVPFLVERLGVKVLPCVICFIDGVSKDRMIGFEELGNNDVFETATLELRLAMSGVIEKDDRQNNAIMYNTASSTRGLDSGIRSGRGDSDDEFDL